MTTPHVALIGGGVLGYGLAYLLYEADNRDWLGNEVPSRVWGSASPDPEWLCG